MLYKLHRRAVAGLSFLLVIAFTFASTSALQRTAHSSAKVVGTPVSLGELVIEDERPRLTKEDILWLARAIYSETKRPHEQELVAWVVRNRVETGYRGRDTYRGVVLDRYQFSAINSGSPKRHHYSNLEWNSQAAGFQTALSIAAKVATAPASERPFAKTTRHFYSQQSMRGGRTPNWAKLASAVALDRHVEAHRFRFYENIL